MPRRSAGAPFEVAAPSASTSATTIRAEDFDTTAPPQAGVTAARSSFRRSGIIGTAVESAALMIEECEFIVDSDEAQDRPCPGQLTGWEVIVFELADEEETGSD
jgi:hypothetical protein